MPFVLANSDYVAHQYRQLWTLLAAEDRSQDGMRNAYRDLRLVVASFGFTMPGRLYLALQVLGGGAIVGMCILLRHRGARMRLVLDYAFSATMCWFMLLGPATEKATYVLVAPSLIWTLLAAVQQHRRVLITASALANGLALLSLLPIDLRDQTVPIWRWCLLPYSSLVLGVTIAIRGFGDLQRRGTAG